MAIKEIKPRHDNTMVVRKWIPEPKPKTVPPVVTEIKEEVKEGVKEEENPLEFLTEIPEVKLTRKRK